MGLNHSMHNSGKKKFIFVKKSPKNSASEMWIFNEAVL